MVLTYENDELVDIEDIRAELVESINNGQSVTSEDELTNELESYYNQALDVESEKYGYTVQRDFIGRIGKKILGKVQKLVCETADSTTTPTELVDIILDVISSVIPGGIIIKPIVKKLVQFIVKKGVTQFCAITF